MPYILIATLLALLLSFSKAFAENIQAEIGLGLYQPVNGDLDYAVLNAPPTQDIDTISPGLHFGYDIRLGYQLCPHAEVVFNYQHFHSHSHASIIAGPGQTVSPPFENSSPLDFNSSTGSVEFDTNDYSLMLTRPLDLCNCLEMQLFGGISFFNIDRRILDTYTQNTPNTVVTVNPISQYWGVGPRFSVELSYHFCRNFSLTGKIGGEVLVGCSSTEDTHINSNAGVVLRIPRTDITRAVPEIDAEFALRCSCFIRRSYPLTIAVGYRAQDYINAIDRINPIFDDSFNLLSAVRTTSSFAKFGPFVNLHIGF